MKLSQSQTAFYISRLIKYPIQESSWTALWIFQDLKRVEFESIKYSPWKFTNLTLDTSKEVIEAFLSGEMTPEELLCMAMVLGRWRVYT